MSYLNKIKDKNYTVKSADAEKTFAKIKHLFFYNFNKVNIEGIFINIINTMYISL